MKIKILKNLPYYFKGGVVYLYLQLRIMFHMSRDTINALKKYLKIFEEKGLRRIRGENVAIAEKEVNAVCARLNEVKALPDETVVDVLTGLTNFHDDSHDSSPNRSIQLSFSTRALSSMSACSTLSL